MITFIASARVRVPHHLGMRTSLLATKQKEAFAASFCVRFLARRARGQ